MDRNTLRLLKNQTVLATLSCSLLLLSVMPLSADPPGAAKTIFQQHFSGGHFPPARWQNFCQAGVSWSRMPARRGQSASAYLGAVEQNYVVEGWLISPAVKLAEAAHAMLSFADRFFYVEGYNHTEILISLNYDGRSHPETANWIRLQGSTYHQEGSSWRNTALSLSDFRGLKIHIAFYGKIAPNGNRWWLDAVKIVEAGRENHAVPELYGTSADGAADLLWRAGNADNKYVIFRSAQRHGLYHRVADKSAQQLPIDPASPQTLRFHDPGLFNGITYWYRICRIDSRGNRIFSAPVPITPGPGLHAGKAPATENNAALLPDKKVLVLPGKGQQSGPLYNSGLPDKPAY